MKLKKSLIQLVMLTMVFTGCNDIRVYPKLKTIERVPDIQVKVEDHKLDENSTRQVFNTIKAFRVEENFYIQQIQDYTEFTKEQEAKYK